MSSPRIYVASLADYNAGNLHGVWIDADQDVDQIHEEIRAMLRESKHPNVVVDCPECDGTGQTGVDVTLATCDTCKGTGKVPSAEEYAVHDHEGFEGIKLGEYPDLEKVVMHAAMLAEHDGAWAAYVGVVGEHYATEDGFSECYQGTYKDAEDWAYERLKETGDLDPDSLLAQYFDYERWAHDAECNGMRFIDGGEGVYVFDSNR